MTGQQDRAVLRFVAVDTDRHGVRRLLRLRGRRHRQERREEYPRIPDAATADSIRMETPFMLRSDPAARPGGPDLPDPRPWAVGLGCAKKNRADCVEATGCVCSCWRGFRRARYAREHGFRSFETNSSSAAGDGQGGEHEKIRRCCKNTSLIVNENPFFRVRLLTCVKGRQRSATTGPAEARGLPDLNAGWLQSGPKKPRRRRGPGGHRGPRLLRRFAPDLDFDPRSGCRQAIFSFRFL